MKHTLSDYVRFVPGINPTRALKEHDTKEITYYDQTAFDDDYYHANEFQIKDFVFENDTTAVREGDVIISNSLQLATMVGKDNAGKIPSLNFTKVIFKDDQLNKQYFIYLFNRHKFVLRQKDRESQGNGATLRLPIKALNQLIIPIVSSDVQQTIGAIYSEALKLQSQLKKYSGLLDNFSTQMIEASLQEKKHE